MEHMKKVLVVTTLLVGLASGRAQAQDAIEPAEAPGAGVPTQRTQRELVLPEGYVRGDLALSFGDANGNGDPDFFAHDLGGGISFVENLELGVSLNREWFWPRVGGGLVPIFWDGDRAHFYRIPLYARYQFLTSEHVAIAADVEMNFATHRFANTRRHAFRASLPVRLRFSSFMIDTGFTFEALSNDAQANLYLPAVFTVNATEALFFRLSTGLGILDMRSEGVHMPLFFGGGYSLNFSEILADINLDFGFPYLAHNDDFFVPGPGGDRSSPDIWMVKFSLAVYIDVL